MTTASPYGEPEPATTRAGSPGTPAARLKVLLVPTLVAGVVAVLLAGVTQGPTGLFGAVAGAGLVVVFFTATHLVLDRTGHLPPELTLLVALGLYTGKVVALALTFVLLSGSGLLGDPLHRAALALTVIVCTLAWTSAEVRAAMTARIPTYDLGGRSS